MSDIGPRTHRIEDLISMAGRVTNAYDAQAAEVESLRAQLDKALSERNRARRELEEFVAPQQSEEKIEYTEDGIVSNHGEVTTIINTDETFYTIDQGLNGVDRADRVTISPALFEAMQRLVLSDSVTQEYTYAEGEG